MSIYSLDSSFRQLFPLYYLFKVKLQNSKKKKLFLLSLKLNFQGNLDLKLAKIKRAMVLCPSLVAQSSLPYRPPPPRRPLQKKGKQVLSFGCAPCKITYKCKCFVKCTWRITYLLCLKKIATHVIYC